MSSNNLFNVIQSTFPVDIQPQVVSALRTDATVWDAVNDPDFLNKLIRVAGAESEKWSPAALALSSIGHFPLLKPLTANYSLALPEDLVKKSHIVYQRLSSPITKPKNLSDAAYVSLWLREKRRSSGSWEGLLPFFNLENPEVMDAALARTWQTVLNILISLIPDGRDLLESLLQASKDASVFSILSDMVFSTPRNFDDQFQHLLELVKKLELTDQVKWLMELNLHGHTDIVISLAQRLLELSYSDDWFDAPDHTLDAKRIDEGFAKSALLQFSGENSKALAYLERMGSTLQNWSQSLLVRMIDADRSFLNRARQKNIDLAALDFPYRQQLALLLRGSSDQSEVLAKTDTNLLDPIIQLEVAANLLERGNIEMATALAKQAVATIGDDPTLWGNYKGGHLITINKLSAPVNVLMKVGLLPDAYQLVTHFLSIQPNDLELIEMASDICMKTGDMHGVVDHASVGLMLQPGKSNWYRWIARAYEVLEEWKNAYDAWLSAIRLEPDSNISDTVNLARCAYSCDDLQACIEHCVKILEQDPENGFAYQWIGASAYKLGKYLEAVKGLTRSTALLPGEVDGWLYLADALDQLGDKRKALEVLRHAVVAVPDSSEVNYKLARLCLDFGLETEALPFLKSAASHSPKDRQITTDLVNVLINLGFVHDALIVVEKARINWSTDIALAEAHVNVLFALEEPDRAMEPLRFLIETDNPKKEWLIEFAELELGPVCVLTKENLEPGATTTARNALEKAIHIDSGDRKANILLAEIIAAEGDYASAYACYKPLIESQTQEKTVSDLAWRMQVGFGSVALALGQSDVAIAALQDAVTRTPEDLGALKLYAEALFAGEYKSEGIEIAKRVISLEPADLDNLEWFANTAIIAGYYTEALTALKAGIQYDPLTARRWLQMARIQAQVGDPDGANDTLIEFMQLVGVTGDEFMEAGEVGLRLGDHDLADECYTRAIEILSEHSNDLLYRACIVKIIKRDCEGALRLIQLEVEKEPSSLETLMIESDLLYQIGRPQAAMAVLEHAIELSNNGIFRDRSDHGNSSLRIDLVPIWWIESLQGIDMAHARLARLYEQARKYEPAIKNAKQAIDIKKDNLDHLSFAIRLAYANLQDGMVEELFELFHDVISLIDKTRHSQSRVNILALEALRAFEKGEKITGLKVVSDLVDLAPDNELTKLLMIHSTAAMGSRQEAGRALHDLCSTFGVTKDEESPQDFFTNMAMDREALLREWFILSAAMDVYAWDIVKSTLSDSQEKSKINPRSHMMRAQSLVRMVEHQVQFEELEISNHTPEILGTSHELKVEIDRLLDLLSASNKTEAERWKIRANCIFNPGNQYLGEMIDRMTDAEDGAIVIATIRRLKVTDLPELNKDWLSDPRLLMQLSLTLRSTDGEQANVLIQRALSNRPNDPVFLRTLAIVQADNQNYPMAYAAIQNALKWWDDEPMWHLFASAIADRLGDVSSASRHAEYALQLKPESVDIQVHYMNLCIVAGKPLDAINAIQQTLTDDNIGDQRVLKLLTAAYYAADQHDNAIRTAFFCNEKYGVSSENLWVIARSYHAQHNDVETINVLRQLVRLEPTHEAGVLCLVSVLASNGAMEDALVTLEKAIIRLENSLPIQIERCKLIWQLHGVHQVIPILKNINKQYPESLEANTMLAEAMEQAGDLSGAESIAAAGLKKNAAVTELNAIMGRLKYRAGQLDRAISYFSEAIRQSPGTLQNYLDLANVYLERREHLQGLRVYQQAIRAIPNDAKAYLAAAKIMKDCRDFVGAESMLRKAANLNPDDVAIRRQLGAIIALNLVHHAKEVGSPS